MLVYNYYAEIRWKTHDKLQMKLINSKWNAYVGMADFK